MRKFFILFGIPFLFLFSFTTNEDLKFDLISPMGFKLAKSQTELIKLLDNDDIKFITNIKYIENERFNAAIVDVELANHSILTYIVGRGDIISSNNIEKGGSSSNKTEVVLPIKQ